MQELEIVAAGREIPDALDNIRHYCGLAWSGGPPETWAWDYYDAVPTPPDNHVSKVDVLCAAALHSGLRRADLAYFNRAQDEIADWLSSVPTERRLWELSNDEVNHLALLPEALPGVSVSLLSKVLHRKRRHLIPLLDRHVIDWYRPVTGKRVAAEAWAPLVRAMRDEELQQDRQLILAIALGGIGDEVWSDLPPDDRPRFSWIRAIDIAIWMGSR